LTARFGKRFRLVAIDLDGTLVDGENNISKADERAVRDVRAQGIEVVLVSGRPEVAVQPIFSKLGLALPLISSGGAHVVDRAHDRLIAEFLPPTPDVRAVVELARADGLTLIFQTSDELFCEGSSELRRVLEAAVRLPIEQVDDGLMACPTPIKVTASGSRDALDRLEAEIKRRGLALATVLSGPEYLEITAQGVSKGEALKRLAAYLDIPIRDIAVIGDGHNDLSMFRAAGLAIAMGNAAPEVQAAADVVAPSIRQDGVAWALGQLMDSRLAS
jgi:Cof subfamily protein (haloacid dehalogenase superfamily)